jgi:hypothetical protein
VFAASAQGADGNFDRAWGKNVISGGPTGFEICTVASSCQAGEFSTDLGGELDTPWGAATDSAGNIYVTDTGHNRIQKFDSSGNFLRAWGTDVVSTGPDDTLAGDFEICVAANGDTCKEAAASTGLGGDLRAPGGLATDPAGNVYVANSDNNRIEKYDSAGNFLRTWGEDVIDPASPGNTGVGPEICVAGVDTCKRGLESGEGGAVDYPQGVATDGAGNVYEASDGTQRVDKFDSSGTFQRAWGKDVDAPGSADDTGTGFEICSPTDGDTCQPGDSGGLIGELDVPRGIGADAAGNTYVAEQNNNRIQKFDSSGTPLRAWGKDVIDPASVGNTGTGFEVCVAGVNTCQAGTSGGLGGEMNEAFSAATDQAGNVYVTDRFNSRIQRFSSSGNFQRAWGEDVASSGPGNTGTGFEICVAGSDTCKIGTHVAPAQGGELNLPPGLATDAAGDLYVADAENNRIQKFADPLPPPGGGGPTAVPPAPAPHAAKCKKHKRSASAAKKKCKKKKKK